MNNVIMRVMSFFANCFMLPASSLFYGFELLGVADGGHVDHIQGIEFIALQRGIDDDEFRQVLDVDVGRGVAEDLQALLIQGGLFRLIGSGLGLGIAQSLTTLMGGDFRVAVDGDLFKVELLLPGVFPED